MPISQGRVGAIPSTGLAENTTADFLAGKAGEAVSADLHGQYYTQNYRGKLWSASIFTASAIPIFATNATPNFFIFNPAQNQTNVVLVRINIGFEATNSAAGAIGYTYLGPTISSLVGTAAPVSAATLVTILPGVAGATYNGNVLAGSAATVGGANTRYQWKQMRWSNLSAGVVVATSTASFWSLYEDFNGSMIIPPGVLWAPMCSTSVASTWQISVVAYEAPL